MLRHSKFSLFALLALLCAAVSGCTSTNFPIYVSGYQPWMQGAWYAVDPFWGGEDTLIVDSDWCEIMISKGSYDDTVKDVSSYFEVEGSGDTALNGLFFDYYAPSLGDSNWFNIFTLTVSNNTLTGTETTGIQNLQTPYGQADTVTKPITFMR